MQTRWRGPQAHGRREAHQARTSVCVFSYAGRGKIPLSGGAGQRANVLGRRALGKRNVATKGPPEVLIVAGDGGRRRRCHMRRERERERAREERQRETARCSAVQCKVPGWRGVRLGIRYGDDDDDGMGAKARHRRHAASRPVCLCECVPRGVGRRARRPHAARSQGRQRRRRIPVHPWTDSHAASPHPHGPERESPLGRAVMRALGAGDGTRTRWGAHRDVGCCRTAR